MTIALTYSSPTLLSTMISDQSHFLLLVNFVLLSLQPIIIKTIGKDSDEKRDAQPEVLTNEVVQTQHSISQDISLPLTVTYMNTKEKVKNRKVKAVNRYHTFITCL